MYNSRFRSLEMLHPPLCMYKGLPTELRIYYAIQSKLRTHFQHTMIIRMIMENIIEQIIRTKLRTSLFKVVRLVLGSLVIFAI
jgi:hypothetical protein